jgi:threonine aldolase
MALGEAVIFFNRDLAHEFDYRCKQAGQLASKMRFLAAPWVGLLESGAWLRNAAHANRCARLLAEQTVHLSGVRLMFPQEANAVFLEMPPWMIDGLRERGWRFYTFIGSGGARFMCSWETTEDDVVALVKDMTALAGQD